MLTTFVWQWKTVGYFFCRKFLFQNYFFALVSMLKVHLTVLRLGEIGFHKEYERFTNFWMRGLKIFFFRSLIRNLTRLSSDWYLIELFSTSHTTFFVLRSNQSSHSFFPHKRFSDCFYLYTIFNGRGPLIKIFRLN